jgi:hypothetical protein
MEPSPISRSVIGWQQRGDRTAVAIVNKPQRFRFRRIFKHLEIIKTVMPTRVLLEAKETMASQTVAGAAIDNQRRNGSNSLDNVPAWGDTEPVARSAGAGDTMPALVIECRRRLRESLVRREMSSVKIRRFEMAVIDPFWHILGSFRSLAFRLVVGTTVTTPRRLWSGCTLGMPGLGSLPIASRARSSWHRHVGHNIDRQMCSARFERRISLLGMGDSSANTRTR